MNDSEFLNWVADRLVETYEGESESTEFIERLREIAADIELNQNLLDSFRLEISKLEKINRVLYEDILRAE